MDTKQIINGLLDRADRVADQSAGRIMKKAAERLRELDQKQVVLTNGDRIRAMRDEELALFLVRLIDLDANITYCQNKPECDKLLDEGEIPPGMCLGCMQQWLKQPVKEE